MTKPLALRVTALAALLACLPATAGNVVISQAFGGGGNSGSVIKNDFIELFNRSGDPVSLNGWSIQYGSAAGTAAWGVANLPDVTLQPGQYYLVKMKGAGGGSVDFTSDIDRTNIDMSGSAGKVALVNTVTPLVGAANGHASIVDVLGYGSNANTFEGSRAAGTSATNGLLRADNGCTDSDNNGSDFSLLNPPAPRNSSAPLNSCGVAPVPKPIVMSCPASASFALGYDGSVPLSASDADSIVNNMAIVSAAVPGMSLANISYATEAGGAASATLTASPAVPAGNYPVVIKFTNDASQEASCTINVSVAPPAAVTHTIPQIQGSGAATPFNNTVQTTEGVITAKVGSGFFIQDANGDGDPTTSDAVFVYMGNTNTTAAVGDMVRVTGTVTEYTPGGAKRSYTEFKDTTAIIKLGSGFSVNPTNVELLVTNLADVEGMLVRFNGALTVNDNESLGTRGELMLAVGRREIPTNRYPARSAEALALAAQNAANMVTLDDGIFVAPAIVPYLDANGTRRVGDTVSGLTGVLDFGALGSGGAGFKLHPTEAPIFSQDNERTLVPEIAAGNVKVASANVLNFFTTFTDGTNVLGQTNQGCTLGASTTKGNCRGADSMTEFVRQRDKIVAELKAIDADVVGLMEIQNNGDYAASYLVDSLNAAYGKVEYAYVPKPAATGTDAIRVAMIYKPAKLSLVGGASADADSVFERPPMAQTFKASNGAKFSLVVNHLKSKRCSGASGLDADQGDGQSCYNASRIEQAQRLMGSFVPQVQAASGDKDVLLIGDFNAYGHEDPIEYITGTGFVNQLERFVRPVTMPHSYVFGGESGYLDHALASAELSPQVAGATEWNINADEPVVIDYNLDDKNAAGQALYNALPYRASDHDPVVISLNLAAPYSDVTAGTQVLRSGLILNRATSQSTGTVWITNTSGANFSGPVHYLLNNLPAGVTVANPSGTFNGVPYITVAPSLAAGAQVSLPLKLNNPARVGISYTPAVYTGTF